MRKLKYTLLFIPFMLFFKYIKEVNVAFVAAFWYFTLLNCIKDRTAFLFRMATLCVLAVTDTLGKLTESFRQVFFIKEIKAHEIEHCKAGSVGEKSASLSDEFAHREKLNVARCVASSADLPTHVARCDAERLEE